MTSHEAEPAWVVSQLRAWGFVDIQSAALPADIQRWQHEVVDAAADSGLLVAFLDGEQGLTVVDTEH